MITRKLNRRLFLKTTAIALASFAFGLLAPAEAKNVLRWASQGDALSFDPHAVNETPTVTANRQVYESLIIRAPDQAKEPCLAASWRLTARQLLLRRVGRVPARGNQGV